FKEFIQLLNEKKVEYLVVGGYAVTIHGYPRYTGDLDIWINKTQENSILIIEVLKDFGFSSLNLTSDDFLKDGNVVQLGYPPLRIDILNDIDGVKFSECYTRKEYFNIDNIKIPFISTSDLILNKKASGRHKDIDDLENLISK
ncbi:MAG TPA: nucleotidyltransferase, partial [Bacteroidales bacterium]